MTRGIIITGVVLAAAAASATHLFNVAGRGAGETSMEAVAVSSEETVDNDTGESEVGPLSVIRSFSGTANADCIKFGHIKEGGVSRGIGICIYTYSNFQCVDYVSRDPEHYWYDYDTFRVYGLGGNDFIRFAGNEEGCPTGSGWTIDDNMPDANNGDGFIYSFYGDTGNDAIFTEKSGGAQGYWGKANKRAYGGDGNDQLRGGYYVDSMYGNDGDDDLYGFSSGDWMHGGAGDDCLYGDDGDDDLFGGDGVDWLHGGNGTDTCYCGDGQGTRYSCNGTPDSCDGSASECFIK